MVLRAFPVWILLGALLGWGCSPAIRATVHPDDMAKVFPWPTGETKVTIRARPQTTLNNMCVWFGSYEDAEVTADTTYYVTDELDKQFAYTPSRSPMRRLSTLKHMEIRWPPGKPAGDQALPAEEGKPQAPGPSAQPPPVTTTPPGTGGTQPPPPPQK